VTLNANDISSVEEYTDGGVTVYMKNEREYSLHNETYDEFIQRLDYARENS